MRRYSSYVCVNIPVTAAIGGGLVMVTVGPGFMGGTNGTTHAMENTACGDVSTK